jgi:hypothetical protein
MIKTMGTEGCKYKFTSYWKQLSSTVYHQQTQIWLQRNNWLVEKTPEVSEKDCARDWLTAALMWDYVNTQLFPQPRSGRHVTRQYQGLFSAGSEDQDSANEVAISRCFSLFRYSAFVIVFFYKSLKGSCFHTFLVLPNLHSCLHVFLFLNKCYTSGGVRKYESILYDDVM